MTTKQANGEQVARVLDDALHSTTHCDRHLDPMTITDGIHDGLTQIAKAIAEGLKEIADAVRERGENC